MRTFCCLLILVIVVVAPCIAESNNTVDVRVLIDISGSMRENDPKNLRRPALRMLVNLLQPGTQAGVWTFARWVNMLVPHGKVDAAWKKRAVSLSKKIGSPGQFTNIEEVLRRASVSASGQAKKPNRHLVLLTDGVVDVSKKPGASAASRARIIEELLPAIKARGTTIHAVALSDRADHELLKQLAAGTDGWYQKVATAEELQRVFLRIFEKVGKPDGVPLKGNRFQVDKSIREATLLVFRADGATPTKLHAPDGSSYQGSDIPAGIAWHSDQGYDLITIADPQVGEWRLEAAEDPDNRVMIVTDLKLQTSELPNRLVLGEAVPFTAHLTNKGKVISRRAFLRLVDMSADVTTTEGNRWLPINDQGQDADQQAADGQFTTGLDARGPTGPASLVVTAESSTFVREKRFVLDISLPGELSVSIDGSNAVARLSIDTALMPQVSAVRMWQVQTDRSSVELAAATTADGSWTASLSDPTLPVMASVEGNTRLANHLRSELGPIYAPGVSAPVIEPPVPIAVETPPQPAPVEAASTPPSQPPVTEPVEESSWLVSAALIGAVNLLLVAAGLGWWLLKKRRRGKDEEFDLLEQESSGTANQLEDTTDISREEAA